VSVCQCVRVSECQSVRVSECQSVRVLECQSVRVSECQSVPPPSSPSPSPSPSRWRPTLPSSTTGPSMGGRHKSRNNKRNGPSSGNNTNDNRRSRRSNTQNQRRPLGNGSDSHTRRGHGFCFRACCLKRRGKPIRMTLRLSMRSVVLGCPGSEWVNKKLLSLPAPSPTLGLGKARPLSLASQTYAFVPVQCVDPPRCAAAVTRDPPGVGHGLQSTAPGDISREARLCDSGGTL